MDHAFYHNIFGVDEPLLEKLTAAAMEQGASWADLYFEYSTYRSISLRDGIVSTCNIDSDYGVGIRALKGERTGYSFSESTEIADMFRAAKAAGAIAAHSRGGEDIVFGPSGATPSRALYGDGTLWKDALIRDQAELLQYIDRRMHELDPRITQVMGSVSSTDSYVLMYNSLGEEFTDYRPMGSLSISVIFSDGKVKNNRNASRSLRKGAAMMTRALADELMDSIAGGIDRTLEAKRPKGGEMPVVLGAGASGILLHEAMGHAFEADFNRKDQSIFSDKMGHRVASEGINIIDDGTMPENRGACTWDDEGVAGQKTYMVRDGILTSYLHDRISAAHYGVEPTGNGRRESFRFPPIPRMRLTYMESGPSDPSDIIASVRKGIFVDEFSNGQVKIGEGDFTFYVNGGYLIENGRLTMPIKDVNIIGNGPAALADITAVGNDLKIDNSRWICGKDQNVAVGCGMPTVLVRSLTVGGE